jgi:hypothetical protein
MPAVEHTYPEEMFEVARIAYDATRLEEYAQALHERAAAVYCRLAPEALRPGNGASEDEMAAYWQPFYAELDRRSVDQGA